MSKTLKVALTSMFAFAFAFTASASAPVTTFGSSMKMGSTGASVKELQMFLNACADTTVNATAGAVGSKGFETMYFGAATKAAVMKYQAKAGVSATGFFGTLSRAAAAAKGNECADSSNGSTGSTGTTGSTGGSTTLSGTEGNLTSVNKLGLYNNTKVNEGSKDVAVYAMEMTAKDADQKVDGFNVSFVNNRTSGTSSLRFTRVASEISIWLDGKEIGRKMSSAYSDDANDIYSYRFSGMNGIVKKDAKAQLVVAVTPVSTFDSNDVSNDIWKVIAGTFSGVAPTATDNSGTAYVSAMSANGRYRDYGSSAASATIDFQKATGEATFKVTTSSTSPVARTIQVSKTADTTNTTLLAFDMKAENSSMLLQKLPISIVVASATPATSAQTVVKNLKLYVDGNLVTSESAPSGLTGTVTFGNTTKLQKALASNATAKVEVKADIASRGVTAVYAEGTTVTASYAGSATVELDNANRDTVTNMTGSVTGENQTLRTTGALVTMGSATAAFLQEGAVAGTNKATYTIPLTVKAFDDTVYVGQTIQAAVSGAISGTNAFSFAFNNSTAPSTAQTTSVAAGATGSSTTTTISSNATVEGSAWRVDAGSEKTFTVQVLVSGSTAVANVRVQMNDFKFFTDAALTAGATVQELSPMSSFQTIYSSVK